MDSGAFIIGVVLLTVIIGYVIWPWFKARQAETHGISIAEPNFLSDDSMSETAHEKLITALRDLEFDYVVEKVGKADYQSLRNNLLTQLAELAELAHREETDTHTAIDEPLNNAHTPQSSAENCPHCGEALRHGANFCTHCGETTTRQQCADCGSPVVADDQFCTVCGFNLEVIAAKTV